MLNKAWDDDMRTDEGIGEIYHSIEVEAAYSPRGTYDRWMKLDDVFNPHFRKWENYPENVLIANLSQLEDRGKVQYNLFERIVRIDPGLAKKEMKERKAMGEYVTAWEKETGSSFTRGT